MNTQMTGGVTRHIVTIIAGALLTNNSQSLDDLFKQLLINLANGDVNALAGSVVGVFAVLWSIWTKLTEEKKANVVNTLMLRKEKS